MATRLHDMTNCYKAFIFYTNVIFTSLFIIEAFIKIVGLGPKW